MTKTKYSETGEKRARRDEKGREDEGQRRAHMPKALNLGGGPDGSVPSAVLKEMCFEI